jgi:hypothetical protein
MASMLNAGTGEVKTRFFGDGEAGLFDLVLEKPEEEPDLPGDLRVGFMMDKIGLFGCSVEGRLGGIRV